MASLTEAEMEALILNFYQARQKTKEPKQIWHKHAANLQCLNDTSETGTSPCYYAHSFNKEVWCENCRNKTQHRRAYHKASEASGAALRAILRVGKKLVNL